MASGIGSKEDLDKTGVETKIEMNGVGKGLRDHTMAGVSYNAKVGASEQYLTNPVKSVSHAPACRSAWTDCSDSSRVWRSGCTMERDRCQAM